MTNSPREREKKGTTPQGWIRDVIKFHILARKTFSKDL